MPQAHPTLTSSGKPSTLEYLGFHNAADRREYVLRARWGPEAREYTVWITHAAFAARQALLQDGPDICYQKLRRELAEGDTTGLAHFGVTETDLASYRAAHAPPTRRAPSPKPAAPAPTTWMSPSSPPLPDGRG